MHRLERDPSTLASAGKPLQGWKGERDGIYMSRERKQLASSAQLRIRHGQKTQATE
jgi:hypothetical protein